MAVTVRQTCQGVSAKHPPLLGPGPPPGCKQPPVQARSLSLGDRRINSLNGSEAIKHAMTLIELGPERDICQILPAHRMVRQASQVTAAADGAAQNVAGDLFTARRVGAPAQGDIRAGSSRHHTGHPRQTRVADSRLLAQATATHGTLKAKHFFSGMVFGRQHQVTQRAHLKRTLALPAAPPNMGGAGGRQRNLLVNQLQLRTTLTAGLHTQGSNLYTKPLQQKPTHKQWRAYLLHETGQATSEPTGPTKPLPDIPSCSAKRGGRVGKQLQLLQTHKQQCCD